MSSTSARTGSCPHRKPTMPAPAPTCSATPTTRGRRSTRAACPPAADGRAQPAGSAPGTLPQAPDEPDTATAVTRPPRANARPPPADRRWRFSRLLSAPHRLGFAAAALMFAMSALWWAAMLAARFAGIGIAWAVPPAIAHGWLFALGFMPLFICGFLFTAGPRWLRQPDVDTRVLQGPVALMVAGWALALPGFHLSPDLAAAGTAATGLGWAALMRRFVGLLRASRAPDRRHAALIAASGAVGVAAFALATVGFAAGALPAVRVATVLAIWGFLAPTFATASHRMLPFFGASALPALDAWRPDALLRLLLGLIWLQGGFALAALWPVTWPPGGRWAQAGFDVAAAALLLWLAWRWSRVQNLRIRMLAMLQGGFTWLGGSFALAAASHALMAASGDARSLGLAPLHALTMGYLGARMVAMTTRVAAGHSGRPVAADGLAWGLYWTLQGAVVLRVAAAVAPAMGAPGSGAPATLAAAGLWALAAGGWALRYGSWLGRARFDARPG